MPKHVRINEGECLASIAFAHGHVVETVWEHEDNAALREARHSPYVLLPGDAVVLPDIDPTPRLCETTRRHTFRRKGVPEKYRLRVADATGPRANALYTFEVDGEVREGRTDDTGLVEQWIPPAARTATLTFPDQRERYEVRLGGLDPASTESGARARLHALDALPSADADEAAYLLALCAFQGAHGLKVNGQLDPDTVSALIGAHGS
jgi:N-acetylmuramoyl-L-alanine amidase